jgi:hypothetical protein
LPGGNYREAAARLTEAGYPTKERDFENARRGMKNLPERVIPHDAPGIAEFINAVQGLWPGFRSGNARRGAEFSISPRRKAIEPALAGCNYAEPDAPNC